jgi:hypothetical protein
MCTNLCACGQIGVALWNAELVTRANAAKILW